MLNNRRTNESQKTNERKMVHQIMRYLMTKSPEIESDMLGCFAMAVTLLGFLYVPTLLIG